MKKPRHRMRASYLQTLAYYDGPILALLQNRRGQKILAFAIRDPIQGLAEPFIAKVTSDRIFNLYLNQKVDLNFVMTESRGGEPFIFDWSSFEDEVLMNPIESSVADFETMIPGHGYFSRNHTEPYSNIDLSLLIKHTYRIDGNWSAKDFARFYNKIDDLYSIFSYLGEIKDSDRGALNTSLSDKIAKYTWRRGGSYFGFFKDIVEETRQEYPLKVSKIQYASPGKIEVKGIGESLSQIDALIPVFEKNSKSLQSTFKELRGILQRDGVLGSENADFSNEATGDMAKGRATQLLSGMGVPSPEQILEACGGHLVVYSKISLAIYRRGGELYKFYDEGRVSLAR